MNKSNTRRKICIKCGEIFEYIPGDTIWYEQSTYSEKVVICPCCKAVNVVTIIEASGLHVNTDGRYYK